MVFDLEKVIYYKQQEQKIQNIISISILKKKRRGKENEGYKLLEINYTNKRQQLNEKYLIIR